MGKQWYLVTIANEDDVLPFLTMCLDRATCFKAYFPDDPELGRGKEVFCTLSLAVVSTWDGMADCVVVSTPLDFVSRELAKSWMVSTDERKPLWQYELLQHDEVLFRAEDFSVYMVYASDSEILDFQRRGIDTSLWEPISMQGALGREIQPFTEEERNELADDLGELFNDGDEPDPEQ